MFESLYFTRLYLAALHYNENTGRDQATASSGEPLYRMHYPKAMKGEARVKPIKTEATFGKLYYFYLYNRCNLNCIFTYKMYTLHSIAQ